MERSRWQLVRTRVRRAVAARRRPLAALLAVTAVATGVQAARPAPPQTRAVAVVAHDLPAGHVLRGADVRSRDVPLDWVPEGTISPDQVPVGRAVAAPLRAGQMLTDLSVVSPTALQAHPPGTVLTTVRVTDAAATEPAHVGDRVSILATDLRGDRPAAVVAREVLVVALPTDGADIGAGQGAPVVLAVDESTAMALAAATVGSALSLVITGGAPALP